MVSEAASTANRRFQATEDPRGSLLLEESIDHHVVEVVDPLIEMFVEMLATLEILPVQALAREEMLETLEIMEMQLIASTNLLPPLLKWLQCSLRLMECPSHLRCNS